MGYDLKQVPEPTTMTSRELSNTVTVRSTKLYSASTKPKKLSPHKEKLPAKTQRVHRVFSTTRDGQVTVRSVEKGEDAQPAQPRVFTRKNDQICITQQKATSQLSSSLQAEVDAAAMDIIKWQSAPAWAHQDYYDDHMRQTTDANNTSEINNETAQTQFSAMSPQEHELLHQAATAALHDGLEPTTAQVRLGNRYQALQQQNDLTATIIANKSSDGLRFREQGESNLSSHQAAELLAHQRHMRYNATGISHSELVKKKIQLHHIKNEDAAYVDSIVNKIQGVHTSANTQQEYNEAQVQDNTDIIISSDEIIVNNTITLNSNFESVEHIVECQPPLSPNISKDNFSLHNDISQMNNSNSIASFSPTKTILTAQTSTMDNTSTTTISAHQNHLQKLKQVSDRLPLNFKEQALDPKTCSKLLDPVLLAIRDLEDDVLGERFALKRESNLTLYLVEEDIFGTGFQDEERITHSMLEFLMVLASQNQDQPFAPKQCDDYGCFAFMKRRNLRLRQILFNNPKLKEHVDSNSTFDVKWREWFNDFSWQYVVPNTNQSDKNVQPYLQPSQFDNIARICNNDFNRFFTLIEVLRSWAIDTDKDRQWSTIFLFPFGYEALFWEINKEAKLKSNLMAGSGQNIFCMLARAIAKRKDNELNCDLGKLLVQRFFDPNGINEGAGYLGGSIFDENTKFNDLLEVRERDTLKYLQNNLSFAERMSARSIKPPINISPTRYLPYCYLNRYTMLLKDFENISNLDLTKQELFVALGTIGALHQICYLMEQEKAVLNLNTPAKNTSDINFVVVVNPEQKTALRALSIRRLKENKALFAKARTHYIRTHWQEVIKACIPDLNRKSTLTQHEQKVACNVLRSAFDFNEMVGLDLEEGLIIKQEDMSESQPLNKTTTKAFTCADLAEILVNNDRKMHMEGLHINWCKDIGFASHEGSVPFYYSISDELLYYLVLALVPKGRPMPLAQFLRNLKDRYHIIIGPLEAKDGHYTIEEAEFVANETQLKLKLQRNHLLISMSDGCDYVRNPFTSSVTPH